MTTITAFQALNMAVSDHRTFKPSQLKTDGGGDTPAAGHIYFSFGNALVISGSALAGSVSTPTLVSGQLVLTLKDTLGQALYSRDDAVNIGGGLNSLVNRINLYNGFTGKNLAGNDTIVGSPYDDILRGFAGNDQLDGGEGNDTLDGGKGLDTLLGGQGHDVYILDNVADRITEFAGQGTDTVKTVIDNYILGDELENLTLTGHAKRTAVGNALDNVMIGNAGNNILFGMQGNDRLDGGKGKSILHGGEGDDTYVVNNKNDKLIELAGGGIDTVESRVSYSLLDTDGKQGVDGGNIEHLTLIGKADINVVGNALDNILLGNSGNNYLTGGAGADTLNGAAGSDIYRFNSADEHTQAEIADSGVDVKDIDEVHFAPLKSAGDSTFTLFAADTGIERVLIDSNRNAMAINLDASQVGNGLIMVGHAGVNSFIGTDYADTLKGKAGKDVLNGGLGDDILDGGEAADLLQGGDGDDTYFIDVKNDTIIDTSGWDTVKSALNEYTLDAGLENLILIAGTLKGTGNALDNVISGNSLDNVIDGASGNDTLHGEAGNDTYLIRAAGDHVQAEINDTEGTDEVRFASTESGTLTLYADDSGIERVVLGKGANPDADTTTLSIDASRVLNALTIVGNAGANTLIGTQYDDNLDGGGDADILNGGAGDDSYVVDNQGDTIIDSDGKDTVIVKTALHDYTLAPNIENLVLLAGGALYGYGNELDNIIIGNGSANFLSGGDGADKLVGNEGNDILDGGNGKDKLEGGSGDDNYNIDITAAGDMQDAVTEKTGAGTDTIELLGSSKNMEAFTLTLAANLENINIKATGKSHLNLMGNELNNVLIGNDADNVLTGGLGNDKLTGGEGDDVFVFSSLPKKNANHDSITDFVSQQDTMHLSASIFTALGGTGVLNADYFIVGSAAKDENDFLIYDASNGKVYYDRDGAGTAAQVELVSLTGMPELVFNDFFII